jgi:hypothetical protein
MREKAKRPVAARVSSDRASCYVFSTAPFTCPLCHQNVPPNTHHECEKDGGITTVRNRPHAEARR